MAKGAYKRELMPYSRIGKKLGISETSVIKFYKSGMEKITNEFGARGISFEDIFYD